MVCYLVVDTALLLWCEMLYGLLIIFSFSYLLCVVLGVLVCDFLVCVCFIWCVWYVTYLLVGLIWGSCDVCDLLIVLVLMF